MSNRVSHRNAKERLVLSSAYLVLEIHSVRDRHTDTQRDRQSEREGVCACARERERETETERQRQNVYDIVDGRGTKADHKNV